MKKLFVLLFVLTIAIYGCGKKQDGTTIGDNKDKPKTETTGKATEIDISDSKAYHVIYNMTTKEGKTAKMTLEFFIKGTRYRSEASFDEKGVNMKATGYYKDKTVYTVMDMNGKKFGMKMKAADLKEDGQAKNYDAYIMRAKEYLKDFDKIESQDIIGFTCNGYKDKSENKYYIYKDNIMMKFEGKSATIEATKLEPSSDKDDSFFDPPTDIDYSGLNMDALQNLK